MRELVPVSVKESLYQNMHYQVDNHTVSKTLDKVSHKDQLKKVLIGRPSPIGHMLKLLLAMNPKIPGADRCC